MEEVFINKEIEQKDSTEISNMKRNILEKFQNQELNDECLRIYISFKLNTSTFLIDSNQIVLKSKRKLLKKINEEMSNLNLILCIIHV